MTKWANDKLSQLELEYGEFYSYANKNIENANDDRHVFITIYNRIKEAIEAVNSINNAYVYVALDEEIKKSQKILKTIQKQSWEDFKPDHKSSKGKKAEHDTDFDANGIISKLDSFETEKEAEAYLCGLKMTKSQYLTLAKHCNITFIPKTSSRADIVKRLVDFNVSSRLCSKILENVINGGFENSIKRINQLKEPR